MSLSSRLPVAVQATVGEVRRQAAAAGGPVVDLSLGAPIDPTPEVIQAALATAGNSPGYPLTVGRADLRDAFVDQVARVHDVDGLASAAVLPVIGTKELIGSLPLHLGLGAGDVIARPTLAYPTYAVGSALVGAHTRLVDDIDDLERLDADGERPALLWINSPSNPTGRVLDVAEMAALVAWCRERSVLLVSDECYLDLGWEETPRSVLHPDVCGSSHTGLLAVHSLSKRSNLAGYRCGFVAGDAGVVAELADVRRNLGLQMPGPQQQVAIAALGDDAHVEVQRQRYAERRQVLRAAVEAAGFRVDHSRAGLYLWVTRGESSTDTVTWLASRGIVSVGGHEYGPAGERHVRLALTASDDDVALAAARIHPASDPAPDLSTDPSADVTTTPGAPA